MQTQMQMLSVHGTIGTLRTYKNVDAFANADANAQCERTLTSSKTFARINKGNVISISCANYIITGVMLKTATIWHIIVERIGFWT